jgi:hypothetical protein
LTTAGTTTASTSNTQVGSVAATNAAPVLALGSTMASMNGGNAANAYPDLVAKIAWDSPTSTAHFEVRGITRFFRSGMAVNNQGYPINAYPIGGTSNQTAIASSSSLQAYGTSTAAKTVAAEVANVDMNTAVAWGFGMSAVVPIIPKKADFVLTADYGAGIGSRYNPGAANTADATIKVNSGGIYVLQPIKSAAFAGGIELHPTPKWDLYALGGNEYYQRINYTDTFYTPLTTNFTSAGAFNIGGLVGTGGAQNCGAAKNQTCLGYGNSGINALTSDSANSNRDVWEGTVGYVYKLWTGSFGTVQTYGEYQYIHRAVWQTGAGVPEALKGNLQMFDIALRYILP